MLTPSVGKETECTAGVEVKIMIKSIKMGGNNLITDVILHNLIKLGASNLEIADKVLLLSREHKLLEATDTRLCYDILL